MTDDEFERTIKEMHASISRVEAWVGELMPAARVAIKMMDARTSLVKRWRGGNGHTS